jgi:hypothetical protein
MTLLLVEVGYLVLMCLPFAVVVFLLFRQLKRNRVETKAPFSELRRPAGESNRVRVQELDERIDPWLITLTVIPILFAVVLAVQKPSWLVVIVYFLLATIVAVLANFSLRPLVQERSAYQLGFHGERYVAEELNQLMSDGFRVFHDIPFDNYNVDHVLVGPTGVFVVETKTKRKRRADEENYKVLFDGTRLTFPSGNWDADALDQARLNAKSLSQWLSSATADQITARPILTVPGWFVELAGRADIYVTNPKQIRKLVLGLTDDRLTSAEIQRASHQLEQKCKVSI